MSLERIEVNLDMCALRLSIALDQLDLATAANRDAIAASQARTDQELGRAMEAECAAGMIAIAGAAFALDAFYAALKERSPRAASIAMSTGNRRPTRYKIIAEAIRREFRIGPKGFANMVGILRQVFRFRDYAVHPRMDFAAPVLKEEVNKATEWRFVSFSAGSARNAVRGTLALLVQVLERPRDPSPALASYLDGLRKELGDLATRWRATYGLLTDDE